ncbi:MarR family transcriptional regulator [Alicyclobacillus cycloheptanicus]|uniref:DNA-binding MarR family transcriptional regulator n=1 Tax=Alicyclobacillus cycloheptanicus TaxID=1457 RepID=A0ABT9XGC6_9BACL|nr:MarR family transcriptional regulator [Alicyclobacillus cycloheptanicus]MDQ0189355.1 DNA-binding MarR family transcriptional regulator [Alicyclobacillus cycloheptanicus]WDM01291.1 MarR family transcriptional regulator [Alicyclobacillus cycloheptanicus]
MDSGYMDQFLTYWQAINRHLRRGMLSAGTEHITRLQWMLLRHVHKASNTTMGSLAEKFGVRPSTVSQMTDRLEKAGLVTRLSGTQDARQKVVRLTPKGEELIHQVEAVWAERLVQGLNHFTDSELAQLIELLGRLANAMRDANTNDETNTNIETN